MRLALNMVLVATSVILLMYGFGVHESSASGPQDSSPMAASLSPDALWLAGAGALCAAFGVYGVLRVLRKSDI